LKRRANERKTENRTPSFSSLQRFVSSSTPLTSSSSHIRPSYLSRLRNPVKLESQKAEALKPIRSRFAFQGPFISLIASARRSPSAAATVATAAAKHTATIRVKRDERIAIKIGSLERQSRRRKRRKKTCLCFRVFSSLLSFFFFVPTTKERQRDSWLPVLLSSCSLISLARASISLGSRSGFALALEVRVEKAERKSGSRFLFLHVRSRLLELRSRSTPALLFSRSRSNNEKKDENDDDDASYLLPLLLNSLELCYCFALARGREQ